MVVLLVLLGLLVLTVPHRAPPNLAVGDQLFISFDDEAVDDLQCTYRLSWQDGPDAHTVALGCSTSGAAPFCYDQGEELYVLFACLDQSSCPFSVFGAEAAEARAAAAAEAAAAARAKAAAEAESTADDDCSSFSSCDSCSASGACGWCVGQVG